MGYGYVYWIESRLYICNIHRSEKLETIRNILDYQLFHISKYELKVETLIILLVIFFATRIVLWVVKRIIAGRHRIKDVDKSNTYALLQIIRYVAWVIALSLMLDAVGVNLTVLLAGSAALLVGIGLGLQHTFNDIVSGIILLLEGSTKVGDVLEIDGNVVTIQSIGLRTSKGLNRDDIIYIIPNSLITTNKVINWSHQSNKTRFRINVGVAYGSDVELVIRTLRESALEHPDITEKNLVEARLIDFGNSSLDFQLLFFSQNVFRIEKVKSDIRRIIDRKFRENGIVIPFPQVDVHMKTSKDHNINPKQ